MLLDIPFIVAKGDPDRCYPAAMLSALRFFYPENQYSLDQIDRLIGRKKKQWTYTQQIAPILYDLGLNVRFYSRDPLEMFLSRESVMSTLRKDYDAENYHRILSYTNVDAVVRGTKKCIERNLFQLKRLQFKTIENHLIRSHLPLILIDYNILSGQKGGYQGHFVVMTGFDEKKVYYHENAETIAVPNKVVKKEKFIAAWDNIGTGNDIIIVLGKRKP